MDDYPHGYPHLSGILDDDAGDETDMKEAPIGLDDVISYLWAVGYVLGIVVGFAFAVRVIAEIVLAP